MRLQAFEAFAPFSPVVYVSLLGLAFLLREFRPQTRVPQTLVDLHNYFLATQSVLLVALLVAFYVDISRLIVPGSCFVIDAFNSPARFDSALFEPIMICFLLSKLYEALDTVILIINHKKLIVLHCWHHATTFIAFSSGAYTAALFWIGILNSAIHVVMYLYYARVSFIKPVARWITSMQIFHLFGGVACNLWSLSHPIHPRTQVLAVPNMLICLSYGVLFVRFYRQRYLGKQRIKRAE